MRNQMPNCRRFVEDFERVFGKESVKVTYASENGITLGKEGERGLPLSKIMLDCDKPRGKK